MAPNLGGNREPIDQSAAAFDAQAFLHGQREAGFIGPGVLLAMAGALGRHKVALAFMTALGLGVAAGAGQSIQRPELTTTYNYTPDTAVKAETSVISWGKTSDLRVATAQFKQTLDLKDLQVDINTKPSVVAGISIPTPDPFPTQKITREQTGKGTFDLFVPLRDDPTVSAVTQTVRNGKIYIVVDRSKTQVGVGWDPGYPLYKDFQYTDKGGKNFTDTSDFGTTILGIMATLPGLIGRDDMKSFLDAITQSVNTSMNIKGLNEFKKQCLVQLSAKADEAVKEGVLTSAKALGKAKDIGGVDFTTNPYPWAVPQPDPNKPASIDAGLLTVPMPNLDAAQITQASVCDTTKVTDESTPGATK